MLFLPPIALVLAVVGLVSGKSRAAAIAALVLSALQVAFVGAPFVARLCK